MERSFAAEVKQLALGEGQTLEDESAIDALLPGAAARG
jgi:hypothetical protein